MNDTYYNKAIYYKDKVKQIPTELNYSNSTQKQLNRIKKQSNKNTLFILFLILWNLTLSFCYFDFIYKWTANPEPTSQILFEPIQPPFDLPETLEEN